MTPAQRRTFDEILERHIESLPDHIREVMDEVPLIVEDEPSARLMADMHLDPRRNELCGLHWGIALTERSVQHSGTLPDRMMLFRGPIMRMVGRPDRGRSGEGELDRQVRITLLHEIGHHFGLDEDDLRALGYG